MTRPWNLNYWKSGEWQVCDERLHDLHKAGLGFNPVRAHLFNNLACVSVQHCRVAIIGQDPYPQHEFARGHAFSIPEHFTPGEYPPTLREIFAEYQRDLGYPIPPHGSLRRWIDEGVLLWNVIPTCTNGLSLSHDWVEYEPLNREVLGRLSDKGIVFAFLGGVAKRYLDVVNPGNNRIIATSHPSPRGSRSSRTPFNGSRLFSTINDKLNELGLDPIEWRLDDGGSIRDIQGTDMDGSRVLQNITGVDLGGQPRKIASRFYAPEEFQQ